MRGGGVKCRSLQSFEQNKQSQKSLNLHNMYCGSPLTFPLIGADGKEKKKTSYNHNNFKVVFLLMFKHGFCKF